MNTLLLIQNKEVNEFAKSNYNPSLFETAVETLKARYKILTTIVKNGYIEVFNNKNPPSFFAGRSAEEILLLRRKSQEYCGLEKLSHFSSHNILKNPQSEFDREHYIHHLTEVFSI